MNAAAGSIGTVGKAVMEFDDPTSVNGSLANEVRGSLEVANDENIVGDASTLPSLPEMKMPLCGSKTGSTQASNFNHKQNNHVKKRKDRSP